MTSHEPPQKKKAATLEEPPRTFYCVICNDDFSAIHPHIPLVLGIRQQANRELLEQIKAQVQALKTGIVSPGYITACNDIVALLDKLMEADAS